MLSCPLETFEFPSPEYDHSSNRRYCPVVGDRNNKVEPGYKDDKDKKIVVTYSSINGNGFGGYGEVVMGTEGTLILDAEKEAMLFRGSANTSIKVSMNQGAPVVNSYETTGAQVQTNAMGGEPPSRGYREEMEHWAWCIRNPAPENKPHCHPEVALADAVLALTANLAIRRGETIEFQEEWFDIESKRTPEQDLAEATKTEKPETVEPSPE